MPELFDNAAPFAHRVVHPALAGPAWSVPLGPYFSFSTAAGAPGEQWQPLSAAFTEPSTLGGQVAHAAAAMGATIPDGDAGRSGRRAVASTMALGLFARLLSPTIGAELLGERCPEPDPATMFLLPHDEGPVPLRTTSPLVEPDAAAAVRTVALPLADAIARRFHVSSRVMTGNVAAAVVGACHVVAMVRPELTAASEDLRARQLSTGPLAGTGTTEGPFVRSSCCLIHQLPMGYICSNCLLVSRETRMVRERRGQVPQLGLTR